MGLVRKRDRRRPEQRRFCKKRAVSFGRVGLPTTGDARGVVFYKSRGFLSSPSLARNLPQFFRSPLRRARNFRGFLQTAERSCKGLQIRPEVDKLRKTLSFLGLSAGEIGRLWI
jgi:hypothetical protein